MPIDSCAPQHSALVDKADFCNMKSQAAVTLPTRWGTFKCIAYAESSNDPMPHVAMVHEDFEPSQAVFVRIHSECQTGDIWKSTRCDCGEQLERAMQIAAEKGGVIIYLRQEGRGIGLINKLKAYTLQDEGLNTIDANLHLGFESDARTYEIAVFILKDLGIRRLRLMTNNPVKMTALEHAGIEIEERIPLITTPRDENKAYLHTKQDKMGHLLELDSDTE
jgi:GTP cyclohydrolase II